ncbi:hypothetical protein [Scytonema sp. HK-05]|nr:hypothetical protein [Scytonema sp. HK-05]
MANDCGSTLAHWRRSPRLLSMPRSDISMSLTPEILDRVMVDID